MKAHFAAFPEYLYRAASKLDLYVGIGAGIVFLLVAYLTSIDQQTIATVTLAIVALSLFLAGYGVFRDERELRAERESVLRLTAQLSSIGTNVPDPGPDKVSLSVLVVWEIWVTQDVSTDQLALNLTYLYNKPFWQFWKKTRFPQMGLPPNGEETEYRKRIYASEFQPFRDQARFEYIADKNEGGDAHWILELVLITGVPKSKYRVPVFINYDELRRRGTYPPL